MNPGNVGPRPRFIKAQVYRALELIGEHQPIGRKLLSDKLGVGEGSMRTILNKLKWEKLIISTPQGHLLTDKGEKELEKRSRKFIELDAGSLTVGEVDVATIIKKASDKIKFGIEQRDEAIKAGADGVTILVFENEDLKIAGTDIELNTGVKSKLIELFKPDEGDVIIIGTGNGKIIAERGALAAAETLY